MAEVNPGSDALTGSGLGSQSCLDSLSGSDLGFGSVASSVPWSGVTQEEQPRRSRG